MHGADLLSRTTLSLSGEGLQFSFVRAIDELKRVPGVLTAELDADAGRALVAHDAGVAGSSLVSAARRAGVRARILTAPPRPTVGFRIVIGPSAFWSRLALSIDAIVRGKRS